MCCAEGRLVHPVDSEHPFDGDFDVDDDGGTKRIH